ASESANTMNAAVMATPRIRSFCSLLMNRMMTAATIGTKTMTLRTGNAKESIIEFTLRAQKHEHARHRFVDDGKNPVRNQPGDQDERQQRRNRHHFTQVDFEIGIAPVQVEWPMQHGANTFQDVTTGNQQAEHREYGQDGEDRPDAAHHQKLTDKPVQARQPKAGHARKDEDTAENRHFDPQAAILAYVARVCLVVDRPGEQEHGRRAKAMVE